MRRRGQAADPQDFEALKRLLMSKPAEAFALFPACQVARLADLDVFWEIVTEQPTVAARIVAEAKSRGVPL